MTRSSGGVLLIPKYGSNQFVVVNSTEKPKSKPNLAFEQKVSPPPTAASAVQNATKKLAFSSRTAAAPKQPRAPPKKRPSTITLPPIDDDENGVEGEEGQFGKVKIPTDSSSSSSSDLLNHQSSSKAIESSDIDASSLSDESELENTNNIRVSREPTSKRAKLNTKKPLNSSTSSSSLKNTEKPLNSIDDDHHASSKVTNSGKENSSLQSVPSQQASTVKNQSKGQSKKKTNSTVGEESATTNSKNLPSSSSSSSNGQPFKFNNEEDVVQQTQAFISSCTFKRKEAERAILQAQKKFSEYKDASDLRRKEQESQLHSYTKDIVAKTRVLSMFQQITNLSLVPESQHKFKWTQKGKSGEFVALIEYFSEESLYRIQPKVVPEAIDRMDEAYQTFKNEMYISSQQLSLLYERIQNVLSCE